MMSRPLLLQVTQGEDLDTPINLRRMAVHYG
jgi:hypothetical protein